MQQLCRLFIFKHFQPAQMSRLRRLPPSRPLCKQERRQYNESYLLLCPFYQHTLVLNSEECIYGPASPFNLLLIICLALAITSCLLHFITLCFFRRIKHHDRSLKELSSRHTKSKKTKIIPKPKLGEIQVVKYKNGGAHHHEHAQPHPNNSVINVHKKLMRDFRMSAQSARGKLHRQLIAARAIPHLIEINDIDHLLLAINHAQGADRESLPPIASKYLQMGVSYIDGLKEKAVKMWLMLFKINLQNRCSTND